MFCQSGFIRWMVARLLSMCLCEEDTYLSAELLRLNETLVEVGFASAYLPSSTNKPLKGRIVIYLCKFTQTC